MHAEEGTYFIPVSAEAMAEHESSFPKHFRFSDDSGQGTELNTESLRSHSPSAGDYPAFPPTHDVRGHLDEEDLDNGIHVRTFERRKLYANVKTFHTLDELLPATLCMTERTAPNLRLSKVRT